MATVQDAQGRPIQLGALLGQGGEGVVREVATDSTLVAKLYHRPLEGARAEKLIAMVSSGTPEVLKFAAWPISTLHKDNRIVGLLMRKIPRGTRVIHELYTPKTRIREFPKANWLFLLHVAANVARGFAAIHRAGHVVGDVNHGNILVAGDGVTNFIDCDSFQVTSNGRVYVCEVGVPTYTPPELQNRPFRSIQRNQNHDSFGLAVLLFHLLFMGRHPFAGRYSGRGEMPIERAISECRFPFGQRAQQVQMSPPPNTLTLGQIPSPLAQAFERAFSIDAANGASRPSALDWLERLVTAKTELSRCKVHQTHLYYSKLSDCPWCGIEAKGIVLFVELGPIVGYDSNVDDLWRRIAMLPSLSNLPSLPEFAIVGAAVTPSPLYRARGKDRRIRMAAGIITIAAVVMYLSTFKMDGLVSATALVASVLFAYLLPRKLQNERKKLALIVGEYQAKYSQIQARYPAECTDQPFSNKLVEVQKARAEYTNLPMQRQRKLQELERNKYQLQLVQFLDQFNLSDAKIAGIGVGRKQMLSSYGVDTAADISPLSLSQVPGIGPKFAGRLLSWRNGIEPRFRFDPQKALNKLEIDKIDREIRSRRITLEAEIKKNVNEAISIHGSITARRKIYFEQSLSTLKGLAQAGANYRAS